MEELVWRKGEERCERSYKPPATTEKKALYDNSSRIEAGFVGASPLNVVAGGVGGVGTTPLNRREEASAKMNERYLIGQAIQNPFMPNSNYVNDLEIQMNFLTPQKKMY
jgi:hypothetical protein